MPRLVDLASTKPPKMSFKKGSPAFKKRKQVAEGIAKKNPKMPMGNKFAIASSVVKKSGY